MKKLLFFNMTVLLVFGLFVVIATAHNITNLEVPAYGDPRREAKLECHYQSSAGDTPLHSVKWYRDNNEIFRFTPEQQPPIRTFNTSGGPVRGACTMHNCTIYVALPSKYNTRVAFTCEVSGEGPRFEVVKLTKQLTVAVALKEDPTITGAPATVQLGEDVVVNCTTGYGYPPPTIAWFVDGRPEMVQLDRWMPDNPDTSLGSWRSLHMKVTTARPFVDLRCEATQPTKPPYTRTASARVYVARSPHLSMFTASGTIKLEATQCLSLVMSTVLLLISEHSALGEV